MGRETARENGTEGRARMKRTFGAEDIRRLHEARESVKGTVDFNRYEMERHSKLDGRWRFVGWGLPGINCTGTIKETKGGKWMVTSAGDRYLLNEHTEGIVLG